ncbi:MAG: hydantoinase B/oxoprolinase family protein [Bryobacterales bacterium]|nr:hydantoinase B/oxoprolinase family protein [Bryobacterales bacterium]
MTPHDPIELELFRHLFASTCEEMGIVLRKTSFSVNIKERRDYSCAIYDAAGQTVAMGDHMPVHLGAMPESVRHVCEAFRLQPGDVAIVNDPFRGGTHLPDITTVAGVFLPRRRNPSFYVATRAHHADVGGMSPGSMPLAREIYQEGIRIPPILLVRRGQIDRPLLSLLLANVRTPEEREGDLLAQLMAMERGQARLATLISRYGLATVNRNVRNLIDYSERMMRATLRSLPGGRYEFSDCLDSDGFGSPPIRIAVAVTLHDGRCRVDFSQSDPQAAGPVNANHAVTLSATAYVFRCLIQEDVPFTAGLLRPLDIINPPGLVTSAQAPAAMAAGNVETSQRITDVLLGALAQAAPHLIPAASSGTMNNLSFGGWDPFRQRPFAYYETIAGGMGASAHDDGPSATHTHMTNSLNTPIEAFEHQFPVRVAAYRVRHGSGGAGRHSGGDGIERRLEFLAPAEVTILADRRTHPPYGLNGGRPGKSGRNFLIRQGRKLALPGKTRFSVNPGEVLAIETPGAGGFGEKSRADSLS